MRRVPWLESPPGRERPRARRLSSEESSFARLVEAVLLGTLVLALWALSGWILARDVLWALIGAGFLTLLALRSWRRPWWRRLVVALVQAALLIVWSWLWPRS